MGNQGHAGDGIRKSYEAYRAGVIGEVSEVFCAQRRPAAWAASISPILRPCRLPRRRCPTGLAWDLWLGPAAKRDFYRDYLP
jgi:hypothetical protein